MKISLDELKGRVGASYTALSCCILCPRRCRVNRLRGEEGFCHTGKIARVASHNVHTGEEPPVSGVRGSGTIFFSSCNLRCKFCQNYPISQLGHGRETPPHELAHMMLSLQARGVHNINLVTPSHVVPQFLAGLYIARASTSILRHSCESGNLFRSGDPRFRGDDNFSDTKVFNLPIVYNTSGYDGMESLKFLDGVVDVYMPDIKYSANDVAEHYSSAKNYWEVVRGAIKEMYRQVGDLELDDDGIAKSGLIIRHMVLPNRLSGTEKVLKFIAEEISPKTHISLMSQYFPAQDALNDAHINRRLTADEWAEAKALLEKYGLENGWTQDL